MYFLLPFGRVFFGEKASVLHTKGRSRYVTSGPFLEHKSPSQVDKKVGIRAPQMVGRIQNPC